MRKDNKVITIAIIFSICLHVVAIASIHNHSIRWFASNSKTVAFTNKSNIQSNNKQSPKEIASLVLKQRHKQVLKKQKQAAFLPNVEKEKINKISYHVIKEAVVNNFHFTKIQEKIPLELAKDLNSLSKEIVFEKDISHDLINEIKKSANIIVKKDSEKEAVNIPINQIENPISVTINNLMNTDFDINEEQFVPKENLENESILIKSLKKNKFRHFNILTAVPPLIEIPSLDDLLTLSYKDYFDISMSFVPDETNNGYIFAITVIPKSNLKLQKLRQNIFFLVDKSNSIQKDRLNSTRHAITSVLNFLNENDSFNILAYDNKLDVLSNNNLPINNYNITKAKNFLLNQKIGSFFSAPNLSIPLYRILSNNVKDDEINIAVLLTNGDGLNKVNNYKIFNEWTKLNNGNLSLYTLNLSEDNNSSLLELFSSLNKGKQLISTTNRGIKRKLQKLIKSINTPIAKNLVPTAICLEEDVKIDLFASSSSLPHLYSNEPYVILGTTNKLEDFTLFLQGKCANKWFNLKKHISFENAKQGTIELQKEFAQKKASICYEKYLTDSNPLHLKEANEHIENFNDITPIFR